MRLLIEKRPFSWDASYKIFEANGELAYEITPRKAEKQDIIVITSRYGAEKGKIIRRKTFRGAKYEFYFDDTLAGSIKKETMYGVTRYVLNYNRWRVFGNITGWEYDILDDSYMVAHAGDEKGEFPGKYVLDVSYSNNEIAILIVALAMEAANVSDPYYE